MGQEYSIVGHDENLLYDDIMRLTDMLEMMEGLKSSEVPFPLPLISPLGECYLQRGRTMGSAPCPPLLSDCRSIHGLIGNETSGGENGFVLADAAHVAHGATCCRGPGLPVLPPNQEEEGLVLIINGASCAGKSTFGREVKRLAEQESLFRSVCMFDSDDWIQAFMLPLVREAVWNSGRYDEQIKETRHGVDRRDIRLVDYFGGDLALPKSPNLAHLRTLHEEFPFLEEDKTKAFRLTTSGMGLGISAVSRHSLVIVTRVVKNDGEWDVWMNALQDRRVLMLRLELPEDEDEIRRRLTIRKDVNYKHVIATKKACGRYRKQQRPCDFRVVSETIPQIRAEAAKVVAFLRWVQRVRNSGNDIPGAVELMKNSSPM